MQSGCGHDAFLLPNEIAVYGGMMKAFLENLGTGGNSRKSSGDGNRTAPTSIFHQHRLDYDRILELVPPGASVLDLGCGSGGLLARLKQKQPSRLVGVELDEQKILELHRAGPGRNPGRPQQRAGRVRHRRVRLRDAFANPPGRV